MEVQLRLLGGSKQTGRSRKLPHQTNTHACRVRRTLPILAWGKEKVVVMIFLWEVHLLSLRVQGPLHQGHLLFVATIAYGQSVLDLRMPYIHSLEVGQLPNLGGFWSLTRYQGPVRF